MIFLWLNIISGVILAIIFISIIIFDHKNFKLEIKNVKLIVLSAFLVALAVFLNTIIKIFLNSVISAQIFEAKIGNFALVLIGFFCGGTLGFLSGIAADFLGLILLSSGTPVLFFTLTSVFWCIVPYYLVTLLVKIHYSKKMVYIYLFLSYALVSLFISGINPIVLKYMYNLPQGWWLLYLPRIIKYPLDLLINGGLLLIVYRVFTNSASLKTKIFQPELKARGRKKQIEQQQKELELQNEVEIND